MLPKTLILALAATSSVYAGSLSIANKAATSSSAKTLASNLVTYYTSNNGLLGGQYWSWISASYWNTLIHYWHYTGDAQYNDKIAAGIAAQAGSGDFMTGDIPGNDDQLWWSLTCITAAEYSFPQQGGGIDYLSSAKKVFEDVSGRWQEGKGCSAGIGWQIDPNNSNGGYHYKNSITNGLAFQLAARLARLTNDAQYENWANKIFDYAWSIGLINQQTHQVYDGTHDPTCSPPADERWSYNVGVFLYGSAVMLDHTNDSGKWRPHLDGFLSAAKSDFTKNGVLYEQRCEVAGTCNTDQSTFKAYLARWLGMTAALVPDTADQINPILEASAKAAIGSVNGAQVGMSWTSDKFDGKVGAGQQMSGLEVVQARLASTKAVPSKKARSVVAREWVA